MQENKEIADKDFCEIIQMACPYSHDCHVCRLYSDYERARKKSAEMGGDRKTKLRVWHIPQVPMEIPFEVEVSSIEEAWKILNILWEYDLFQYDNNLKPDYCNASGLEYFGEEEKDWTEWEDEDGYSIREHFDNLEED